MHLVHALRLAHPDGCAVVTFVGAGGKTTALTRLAQELVAQGHRVVATTTTRLFRAQAQAFPARLAVPPAGPLSATHLDALARLLDAHGVCFLLADETGDKVTGVTPQVVDTLAARCASLGVRAVLVEGDGSRGRPVKAPADHEPVVPSATTLLVPVLGLDGVGRRLAEPDVHRPERLQALLGASGPASRLTPAAAASLLIHPQGGARNAPPGARLLPLLNKAEQAPRLAVGRLIGHRLAQVHHRPGLVAQVGAPEDAEPVRERWGPTAAVVLAAGESRRLGRPKQLLRLEGEPLIVRAVRLALAGDPTWVVVVLGARAEEVAAPLAPLRAQLGERLQVVVNPDWAQGQATSVAAAVAALPPACEAALFLPVDQPRVPVALLRRLWTAWREGGDRVGVQVEGEIRGAPAVFDRSVFPALAALRGDTGARGLLRSGPHVRAVPGQASWLVDVDTPEDWAQLCAS